MITIGICDDNEFWRNEIRRKTIDAMDIFKQTYSIVEFSSGEEVLEYTGEPILLLFLDIEMDGVDGLEVMRKLEDDDRFWRIVFISCHDELRWNALDIKTLAYISKPTEIPIIEKCIKAAVREYEKNRTVLVNTNTGDCVLKVNDIVYIRATSNYSEIHTKDATIIAYHNLKYYEKLPKDCLLFRTHRSYLVNIQYIKDVSYERLQLIDGASVPVGRVYYESIRNSFFSYIKSMTIGRLG